MNSLGTILGTFSKGVPGSIALNASESGGAWCDSSCHFKRQFELTGKSDCYAIRIGVVRPSVVTNGIRHRENFEAWTRELISPRYLKKITAAPWIRFSAFGTLPTTSQCSDSALRNLETLAGYLDHAKIHMPVETIGKLRLYRSLGYFPRLSVQGDSDAAVSAAAANIPVSMSYQTTLPGKKPTKKQNAKAALASAATFNRLSDIPAKAKVCPAIAGSAKCGSCRLCAGINRNIIIYPQH